MPVRVLIADPNTHLLNLYQDYLSQHSFQVDTATNGLECVEKLRESPPDALVLEPAMPWGGGEGVLSIMQQDPDLSSIPVLVLTYGSDPGLLYNISSFFISDFQKKPMAPKRLMERISKIVINQSMESAYDRST